MQRDRAEDRRAKGARTGGGGGGGGGLLREHCPVTTLLLPIAAPPPRGGILHPNTKAAPLLRAHPTPFPASYASGGGEGARAPQEEAQGAREDTQARPRQGAPQGPPHTYYLTAHYCTTYYLLLIPTQGFVNPPPGVSSTLHTYHSLPACALTCLPLTCKVFVNCLVENPAFDSQTKENMTLKQSAFGSKCTRHLVHHDPP